MTYHRAMQRLHMACGVNAAVSHGLMSSPLRGEVSVERASFVEDIEKEAN